MAPIRKSRPKSGPGRNMRPIKIGNSARSCAMVHRCGPIPRNGLVRKWDFRSGHSEKGTYQDLSRRIRSSRLERYDRRALRAKHSQLEAVNARGLQYHSKKTPSQQVTTPLRGHTHDDDRCGVRASARAGRSLGGSLGRV